MSETVGDYFKGLDMHSLVEGPLWEACQAQAALAESTAKFIQDTGFEGTKDGKRNIQTTVFSFQRELLGENGENIGTQTVSLEVPLLSIVPIPALAIDDTNITFDMEVKSAECSQKPRDKEGAPGEVNKAGFGPFCAKVNIKGTNTSHGKNVDIPEGLERMNEIVAKASSTTPWKLTNNKCAIRDGKL
ncbi:MAG: DUF2589 domain-containing protein [Agathobacter sp.]